MMIMRPPQHGHGCESGLGSLASAQLVSLASGCAAGTSSKRRARAMLSARVPLASRTRHARRALSGRLGLLDLAGDMLQRAYDLPDRLGGDAGIERRGIEPGVPEQS